MVQFRHAQHEIQFKIVYYGPALGGKTTSIEALHELTDPEGKTQVVSLKTTEDRTLFFDFLPFDLGEIQGYHIRFQVYTVPGQVHYNTTRKVVLAGTDAIIFVADSLKKVGKGNWESWENMKANLLDNRMNLKDIPIVIQCNKQDLPDSMSPEEVLAGMRVDGVQAIASSALMGDGVLDAFLLCVQQSLTQFVDRFKLNQKGVTPARIADGVSKVFEPFAGKRRKVSEQKVQQGIQTQVQVKGLTEEEQLIAALESSSMLAESFQDAKLLMKKYEVRLREMTLLYEVGTALAQVSTVRDALSRLPETLARFREGWIVSAFEASGGSISLLACQGLPVDPLWSASPPGAGNLALGLLQRGGRAHVKDLQRRFESMKAKPPAEVSEAVGITFGESGKTLGHLIVYCRPELKFGQEEDRFFNLIEQVVVPRLMTLSLMEELGKSNSQLERRVIERTSELRSALDRLKELDRLKYTFLNNITHEIKTPLTNVRSYADLLLRYPNQRAEHADDYLKIIIRESVHLEEMIDHILSYSKVKSPPRGESCDLARVLGITLDTLSSASEAKKLEIEVQADSESLTYPMGLEDAGILFKQVLENAIKYSPDGDKIKIYLLDDDKKVIFATRDYGVGFPEEQMERLMQPFEQGGSEAPDCKPPGLGMGLYLVREIIQKYGGSVHIERMDPGTNVMLEFPKP